MVAVLVKNCFYRLLLPSALLIALLRPSLISFVYAVFFLIGPLLPSINSSTPVPTSTRLYLLLVLVYSLLATIVQASYQVYESVTEPIDAYTKHCNSSQLRFWFRQVGLTRVYTDSFLNGARVVLPELLSLALAILSVFVCILLSHELNSLDIPDSVQPVRSTSRQERRTNRDFQSVFPPVLKRVSELVIVLLIAITGLIQPSFLNLCYFVVFLIVGTWWALYTPLSRRNFNIIKCCVIFYAGLHVLLIYLYQIPVIQTSIPASSLSTRLVGLSSLFVFDCTSWWMLTPTKAQAWNCFVNPLMILLLYLLAIVQYYWTRNGIATLPTSVLEDDGSSVHEERYAMQRLDRSQTWNDPEIEDNHEVVQPSDNTLLPPDDATRSDAMVLRSVSATDIDRHKISTIFTGINHLRGDEKDEIVAGPRGGESIASQGLIVTFSFILYHSYAIALLAMMLWALLYHSVFGMMFLLAACVIWMFRQTRNVAFAVSPALLLYTEALLMVQYACSLDLRDNELPTNRNWLELIGFVFAVSRTAAVITLLVKTGLSLPIFLLLRLNLREKFYQSLDESERLNRISYGTFAPAITAYIRSPIDSTRRSRSAAFVDCVTAFFSKYWIFLVILVLLLIAISSPPVFYTIGYWIFWTILLILLLVSFACLRRTLFLYWTLLVLYSCIVLIAVYVYQFPDIPNWWTNTTGLDEKWNDDIGLINYKKKGDTGALFVRLFAPISFLAVSILQLKFFHQPWSRIVTASPAHDGVGQEGREMQHGLCSHSRAMAIYSAVLEVLWRLAEIHAWRIVLFILMLVAVHEISALNFVIVLCISFAVLLPRLHRIFALFICVYLSLVAVSKMVFQMHFVSANGTLDFLVEDRTPLACNLSFREPTSPIYLTEWLGYHKVSNIGAYLAGSIVILVAIAFEAVIAYRQRHVRAVDGKPEPPRGVVFPDVDKRDLDRGIWPCTKFFMNYGFYKFGVEISMFLMCVVAWVRMDLLGSLLLLWLFVFSFCTRIAIRRLWPLFLLYLAILLPMQYAVFLGLPPILCIQYPWAEWLVPDEMNENLVMWLDISAYFMPIRSGNLIADFFLLLVVASQEMVFRVESREHPAGDNDSIYATGEFRLREDNPHNDFVAEQRNAADIIKVTIFVYGHWLTLVMVFVAGLGGTSLFALGYIVFAFTMLWQGTGLFVMKNYAHTLVRWNWLLRYNILVMFLKLLLQVVGCVFLDFLSNSCPLRTLFSIVCANPLANLQFSDKYIAFDKSCSVGIAETMIGFDAFAFAFIIVQLRILHSFYFQYCILEFRIEHVLSNRGAVLTNQLVEKEMHEQTANQKRKSDEINRKMNDIRQRNDGQNEIEHEEQIFTPRTYGQGFDYESPDCDDPLPGYEPRRSSRLCVPDERRLRHVQFNAKRAGDYYMFEYDPSDDELEPPMRSVVPEVEPGRESFDKLDPSQLLHTAVQKDLDLAGTLASVELAERIRDEEQRMIHAVSQSPADDVPSTSRSRERQEQQTVTIEEPASETRKKGNPVTSVLFFILKMVNSFIGWTAAFLNRRSREHRYVAFVLNRERERMKQELRPMLLDSEKTVMDIRKEWELRDLHIVTSETDIIRLERDAFSQWESRPAILRLLTATGHLIAAHTDILCYVLAVIAHARCAGLVTLPLPLLVFLWGTLSSPRPSKIFWIVLIAYTQFVIIVKFIFQFGFFEWNKQANLTLTANDAYSILTRFFSFPIRVADFARVLGIYREDYYSFWDVALLVALFFHRYNLRKLGLWRDANVQSTFSRTAVQNGQPAEITPSADVTIEESNVDGDTSAVPSAIARGALSSFFHQLFHPKFFYIRDLYPLMFLLDVLALLIVTFGYSSFGEGGSGDVLKDIQTNRVPITYVVMLMVVSLAMVIDRALYLRKARLCKLIFQLVTVLFIHVWIFFLLPRITTRPAAKNSMAQTLYIIKCVYLLVSAWQIRNGYPKICMGNLITHSYGLANMVFFKIFMIFPFVFELRTAVDWTWTDTSMPLFDFFNMENFYAIIYNLKCAREFEKAYPAPRGEPKGVVVKYGMGLPVVLLLILLIWLPLLVFSLLNRIGTVLTPAKVTLTISMQGYPSLYTMEAQGLDLETLGAVDLNYITDHYAEKILNFTKASQKSRGRQALSFIGEYQERDILVKFRPRSDMAWPISADSREAMLYQLEAEKEPFTMNIHLEFERPRVDSTKEPAKHSSDMPIMVSYDSPIREQLRQALLNNGSNVQVELTRTLPPYVIVPNEGEVSVANVMLAAMSDDGVVTDGYSTLLLTLMMENSSIPDERHAIWQAQLGKQNELALPVTNISYPPGGIAYVQIVAFVDRVFPSFLSKFAQGGVVAMYIAVVLLASRLLRGVVTNSPSDVMISEIPNADHLLKLCLDIYLVREMKDFVLEQDLFGKLIFLFRSPGTLIKWTRHKAKSD